MGRFQEENRSLGASSAEPAGWGMGGGGLQPLREVTLIVIQGRTECEGRWARGRLKALWL